MTQRMHRAKPVLALLAMIGLLLSTPAWLPADVVPGKHDKLVTQLLCEFLQRVHLNRPKLNEEISIRLFERYFKSLDPTKVYFLKSDIEEFKPQENGLAAALRKGDLDFAYKVFGRFVARVGERQKMIEELINAKHDFTAKEYLPTDFDDVDWAKDETELQDRWRKRIKFDLLLQRIGPKPLAEPEAKEKVLTRYRGLLKQWKQLDNYDLMELYLSDLTASIDPHSSYMSPNTLDDFEVAMRLQFQGIGAYLRSENGQTIVSEVLPGGSAAADGRIKINDKIIGVAQGDDRWVDILDMKLRDVVKLIRGPKGTQVQLKIVPAAKLEPVVYVLTRQNIELKSQEARSEIVEQGKKADGTPYRIGVIDLPSFYADMTAARSGRADVKSATEDVRKLLHDFTAKHVDGVVLDLRRNGGGALSEALALTGLFIDHGPVVQVKNGQGRVQRHDDPEKGVAYAGPLMVLVSKFSASASEILAGALQDYGRALIVGDSATHGKGTVQQVIDLGDRVQADEPPKLGALKLTIQQFYRVNGDSTQNRGVHSDVVLPSLTEELGTGEKELKHALAFDAVPPAPHENAGNILAEAKEALKIKSAQRVKDSKEFAKLLKEVEQLKARKARKAVPLNEEELRAQMSKEEAEKVDQQVDGEPPQDPTDPKDKDKDKGIYKFRRNFTNNEILQIMDDLIQSKK